MCRLRIEELKIGEWGKGKYYLQKYATFDWEH